MPVGEYCMPPSVLLELLIFIKHKRKNNAMSAPFIAPPFSSWNISKQIKKTQLPKMPVYQTTGKIIAYPPAEPHPGHQRQDRDHRRRLWLGEVPLAGKRANANPGRTCRRTRSIAGRKVKGIGLPTAFRVHL